MQVEVVTRTHMKDGKVGVVMDVKLLPRGSGNRNAARRLATGFQHHPSMKQHIEKIVVGTSRVTVHLRPSLTLMADLAKLIAEERAKRDTPGQLKLFGEASAILA